MPGVGAVERGGISHCCGVMPVALGAVSVTTVGRTDGGGLETWSVACDHRPMSRPQRRGRRWGIAIMRPGSFKPADRAGREVVEASHNHQLALGHALGEDGAAIGDVAHGDPHVLFRDGFDEGRVLGGVRALREPCLGGLDRGLDVRQSLGQVAKLGIIGRALDRAAVGVPEHDDRLGSRHSGRELHAPQEIGVLEVAGHAADEDVADALVEDDLGGDAGIQAREHDGLGVLAFGGAADLRQVVEVRRRVGHETRVTSLKIGDDLRGRQGLLRFGGKHAFHRAAMARARTRRRGGLAAGRGSNRARREHRAREVDK
jgi:hypothetical protein